MNPALWISKTGLDAQQTNVSVISNNLANASTVGYKKGRGVFQDLLYQTVNQPGGRSSQNTLTPTGLMLGAGSKVVATQKDFSQGNVKTTNNSFDMMINGKGFFEVQMPDGTVAYTRNGQFSLNQDGVLVTPGSGYPIQPQIQIPQNAQSITVSEDGQVSVAIPGQQQPQVVGQIALADFVNPAGLEPKGQNLYAATASSGDAQEGIATENGLGSIQQGSLETSNVNVTAELVDLIEAQRVYEMNSKVISSVDQMLNYATQQL